MIPQPTNRMKAYSDKWRNEVMRLTKAQLVDMMKKVMDERDMLRTVGKELCRDLKKGNATVTMPGKHMGKTYASNEPYRKLSKLTA